MRQGSARHRAGWYRRLQGVVCSYEGRRSRSKGRHSNQYPPLPDSAGCGDCDYKGWIKDFAVLLPYRLRALIGSERLPGRHSLRAVAVKAEIPTELS